MMPPPCGMKVLIALPRSTTQMFAPMVGVKVATIGCSTNENLSSEFKTTGRTSML